MTIIMMFFVLVGTYAYRLFSWSDLFQNGITWWDATHMFLFTVEHMIFSFVHMAQYVIYRFGLSNLFSIELFEDGSLIVWLGERAFHACISTMCMG